MTSLPRAFALYLIVCGWFLVGLNPPCAAQPLQRSETSSSTEHAPGALLSARPLQVMDAPIATRQLQEGYWLGGLMGPQDVPRLKAVGIRVVISAAAPLPGTAEALRAVGIEHRQYAMGRRFKHAAGILEVASDFAAEEIFIHCKHGADRTGCIAAFLLVVKHGWSLNDALYAVVYPTARDTEGLARVLQRHGVNDPRDAGDPGVGFYSVSGTGRATGGLKVRNDHYEQLVSTAIRSMVRHRASRG